ASYANIVVVNNRLAVIFYDAQALQLKIAVANSPAPFAPASAADWTIHAIDPQSCAFHNNATMHNGQLVVTYRVTSGSDLKVARAIVPVPTSTADWNLHLADTGTPAVGLYSAPMSYDDGSGARLVVVHRDSTNQTIKYGKANVVTPASAADWTFHVADAPPGGVPGLYLRIKNFTVSGSPRVAFVGIDASATVPTYSVYTSNVSNPANTADWTKVNLGTPPAGGGGSVFGGDVNVYNGKLVVVWTRVPAANQWEAAMARANVENPTSLADWSISTVDSTINQGIYYTGLFPYALVLPNNDFVVAHRNMGPYVATGSAWRWERRLCPLP
ncbi:MAG TPA: hypothetical protein VEI97_20200, partial [bacterium]|nr:hypothetical protein [bacterium]